MEGVVKLCAGSGEDEQSVIPPRVLRDEGGRSTDDVNMATARRADGYGRCREAFAAKADAHKFVGRMFREPAIHRLSLLGGRGVFHSEIREKVERGPRPRTLVA